MKAVLNGNVPEQGSLRENAGAARPTCDYHPNTWLDS